MKKVIGWILIIIPILNFIGRSAGNRDIPISPMALILLIMMFIGGITLVNSASKKKDKESQTKDISKND
ncbi:hypothetical protein LJC57_00875 [Parabacteroides sp. OttesenSCG-928-G07]|nr:hypothetical protein [Parabacteroides sp. OttesenSCG-928-G21]MDL2277123.1 hypothetical protein [Parabacteroides sp. OttesenSCG-928-G07]